MMAYEWRSFKYFMEHDFKWLGALVLRFKVVYPVILCIYDLIVMQYMLFMKFLTIS